MKSPNENPPATAFAPSGGVSLNPRPNPGCRIATLACPGLGAFAPSGRGLNARNKTNTRPCRILPARDKTNTRPCRTLPSRDKTTPARAAHCPPATKPTPARAARCPPNAPPATIRPTAYAKLPRARRSTHAPEGQKLPAQGKRAKRCDTLGFAEVRPMRPEGAKATTEPFKSADADVKPAYADMK